MTPAAITDHAKPFSPESDETHERERRARVFVMLDYYLPGWRAGGPPRTLANLVERLGDKIDFWIFTRNHDFADETPYIDVRSDEWSHVGKCHVFYCSRDRLSLRTIRNAIVTVAPDVLYLNSFFSGLTRRCLFLRKLRLLPKIPIVIAPRGEFSPNALGLKAAKKRLYRGVVRMSRLYRDVTWQASSEGERANIVREIGSDARIHVASNLSPFVSSAEMRYSGDSKRPQKHAGHARFIFLSRISPMKNLEYALERFHELTGDVVLDIFGPTETEAYWQKCQALMHSLPRNVQATYRGMVSHGEVAEVLQQYHFFVLPTKGENFGHAILEAFQVGCPVITSDLTPWRGLQRAGAGWDLPLDEPEQWRIALQQSVAMDSDTFARHSRAAAALAEAFSANDEIVAQNLALFSKAVAA